MQRMRRVAIGLLLLGLLVSVRWERVFASNVAMITLARCLMPIKWVSYPDRPWSAVPDQLAPSAICLERVRYGAGDSRRVLARLELIAGDIATNQAQWQDAINHYRNAALLIDYPVPKIWNTVAGIYMRQLKDYQTALVIVLRALEFSPKDQDLRVSAGMLYLFYIPPYGDYERAIAVMQPELGFTEPYYYNLVAGSYLALGEFDNGLRMAQESVSKARVMNDNGINLATGLYLLGLMQRCIGQSELGFTNLREAQGLSPEDENIQAALGDDIMSLCKPYGKPDDSGVTP